MAQKLLTAAAVKAAAPREKVYRLRDGDGLFLQVEPSGKKWWVHRSKLGGKQRSFSCGIFPAVTLAEAREAAEVIRKDLAKGIDPAETRNKAKGPEVETLADVAGEWLEKFSPGWSPRYASVVKNALDKDVLFYMGDCPMVEISAPQLLAVLRRVEASGRLETAHRLRSACSQLWRFGIATGRAERDIARDLLGALPPPQKKSMATILEPERIGALLRDLDAYQGDFCTRCCLRLAPLCLLRPGELRRTRWAEVDLESAEIRVPAERMKLRQSVKVARQGQVAHIVPLPKQAVEILHQLHEVTGHGDLVFPGTYHRTRPISESTLIAALRRLGYAKEDQTIHGFRHMASTLLHEMGFNSDLIEKQLAHADRNLIRARYNHADLLDQRRQMLQAWADYLDQLRAGNGGKVVPIRRAVSE